MLEYVGFWIVVASVTAIVAKARGRSVVGWFFLGFVFSLLALALVALLPSRKVAAASRPRSQQLEPAGQDQAPCPFCKQLVLKSAIVCNHCGLKMGVPLTGDQPGGQ